MEEVTEQAEAVADLAVIIELVALVKMVAF
jgi:hypothetical protein